MSYLITLSVTGTEVPREQVPESLRRAQELFRQFHCFPSRSDDSLAARASDSRSARARRRIARVDLSLRSRTARQAAHFCPLLQASPAAHLRCPWQTTLHPGRELPRYTPRPRGLKMLEPIRARPASAFLVPSNGEDHGRLPWRLRSKLSQTRTDHEFQPRIRRGHDRQPVRPAIRQPADQTYEIPPITSMGLLRRTT